MLKKYRLHFALVAALACVGCTTQTGSKDHNQTFKSADTDGNGVLSQQEVHTWLDANGDGGIDPQEWNKLMIDPADD